MKSFSNPTALCWNGGSHSLQRTPAAVCRIVLSEICILPAGSETVKDCMLHTVTYPVIGSDIHNDMLKQKHRNIPTRKTKKIDSPIKGISIVLHFEQLNFESKELCEDLFEHFEGTKKGTNCLGVPKVVFFQQRQV